MTTAAKRGMLRPMCGHRAVGLSVTLGLLLGVAIVTPANGDPEAPLVRYHRGRLTVRIEGVPLDDVLDAVASETGLVFDGTALDRRNVWKRFDDVPLGEALRRLIGRQNFTLVYRTPDRPSRVELLGAPAPPALRKPGRAPGPPFPVLLAQHPPVPVSARLALALGAPQGVLPLPRVLQGLRLDDPATRTDAADAFLHALQTTPQLCDAFLALDDGSLVALARSWAGPRAADALSLLAARAGTWTIRTFATRGLAKLRATQAGASEETRGPQRIG